MDNFVKIFFLVPLSIFIFKAFVIDTSYGESSRFDDFLETKDVRSDFALGQSLITRLTDLSFLDCLKECEERPRCLSVNFFQHFLLCELNHRDMSSALLQPAKGAVFAVLQPWMKDKRCRENNGDENYTKQKCHVDKSGQPIYTISDCGFPSELKNATLDQSNGIGLYSKVVYKCNEGYVQRGKPKISCQDNGQWSSTDFQCLKECNPGQEPDGDACKNCSVGTYSPSRDANKCTKCPRGQYQDQKGKDACMNCTYNDNPCAEPYNFQGTNVSVEPNNRQTECRAVYSCNDSSGKSSKSRKVYVSCDRDGSYRHWTRPSLNCSSDIPDLSGQFPESECEQLNGSVTSPAIVRINDTTGQIRYCAQYADDVWTIIQQRTSPANANADAFNKTWEEYKNGFGSLNDDYWIGNEILSNMTTSRDYEIAILLWEKGGNYTRQRTARYSFFKVNGEDDRYRLDIGTIMVNLSDEDDKIYDRNGKNFSTKNLDSTSLGCSVNQQSGWWHKTYPDGKNKKCTKNGNVNALRWGSLKDKSQILIRPDTT